MFCKGAKHMVKEADSSGDLRDAHSV